MNPPDGQTPLDYLNQIAPQPQKRPLMQLNIKTALIGGAILIVLVLILAGVVSNVGSSGKNDWQQLSARIATTNTIAQDATSKLKNSEIRSLNSDLKLYLTNTQRDLTEPLTKLEIDSKKLPASITAKEDGAALKERLEDARLNAKFDSTYAREMSFQLSTLLALYQKLYTASRNEDTKTFLTAAYDNLLPTQEAFANFSSDKE